MSKLISRVMAIAMLCAGAIFLGAVGDTSGQTQPGATTEPAAATSPASDAANQPKPMSGSILQITGKELQIKPYDFGDIYAMTFDTDGAVITIDSEPATIADFKVGMAVDLVHRPVSPGGAVKLFVNGYGPSLYGTLMKIEGKKLIFRQIAPSANPDIVTVATDEQTRVMAGPRRMYEVARPLSDLQPGREIEIVPDTGTAKKIFVYPDEPFRTEPATEASK